jgi:hypothetical protein
MGLSEIRDIGPLSARYCSEGARLPELIRVLENIRLGDSVSETRGKVKEGRVLTHRSYETRVSVWGHLNRRYFVIDRWVLESLVKQSEFGETSIEFKALAYLYYVLRDRFTYNVVTDLVWGFWENRKGSIESHDVIDLMDRYSEDNPEILNWKESTRKKLSRNLMAALRDFGLLSGNNRKFIQQPSISDETVFHLLCVQMEEGLMGNQIIESRDWRMFLWDNNMVSHNLARLAMLNWIGFEKTGETVMIELIRKPGDSLE